MENKNVKVIAALIVILLGCTIAVNIGLSNKKTSKLGKIEYVTSLKETKNNLPTVIFFKKVNSDESLQVEINLKKLTEEYNTKESKFNLLHINVEEFGKEEVKELLDLYNVHMAPTTVFLNKDGDIVKKCEGVLSLEEGKDLLKSVNVN